MAEHRSGRRSPARRGVQPAPCRTARHPLATTARRTHLARPDQATCLGAGTTAPEFPLARRVSRRRCWTRTECRRTLVALSAAATRCPAAETVGVRGRDRTSDRACQCRHGRPAHFPPRRSIPARQVGIGAHAGPCGRARRAPARRTGGQHVFSRDGIGGGKTGVAGPRGKPPTHGTSKCWAVSALRISQ